jgi:hypothetical protein
MITIPGKEGGNNLYPYLYFLNFGRSNRIMKQTSRNIFPALTTIIILHMVSCSPEACFEETNAFLKASMYLQVTGKNVAPDSVTLYGVTKDTDKIYKRSAGIRVAQMPLNASAESCSFVIKINGVFDTITFGYNSYPHLISKECGYTFYHSIDTALYTRNIIDTVKVTNTTVTTLNEENIRIYY